MILYLVCPLKKLNAMYVPNKHIVFGIITLFLLYILAIMFYVGSIDNASLQEMWVVYAVILSGIILIILLWIFAHKYDTKCPQCHKMGAMQKTREEIMERVPTTRGEHNRPATHYTFHIHRKCKYCGHENYFEYNTVRTH